MKFSASRTALSGLALTVAATALAQPLLAPAAQAATDVPATSAARAGTGWLATQLTNGVIHNDTYDFDDLGMTMDIGLSMDEVGGDQAMVRQIRSALSTRIAVVRRPVGRGALLAARWPSRSSSPRSPAPTPGPTGARPRRGDRGAGDRQRAQRAGRLADLSAYGDYANSFGQALAVRGLSSPAPPRPPRRPTSC